VFPVSLARTLSALRFSSFFSFIISIYIVLAIVFICLFDRAVTPDLGQSFDVAIKNFNISAYMYQTNIPMIYAELEKKDLKHMWKVLRNGTIGASFAYWCGGVFGYTAFAAKDNVKELMELQNILKCYPNITVNYISLFGIIVVILFATPLSILPCKDTVEELFLQQGEKLSSKQNVLVTFVIVLISYILSLAIPNIGDAMTILGATTNSGIGFILPIIYYLKM
jgi:amino acid permease